MASGRWSDRRPSLPGHRAAQGTLRSRRCRPCLCDRPRHHDEVLRQDNSGVWRQDVGQIGGRHCLVTEPLKELCEAGGVDLVYAIGPGIMMKFCAKTTQAYGVRTLVSLNSIMVDRSEEHT